jgi:hypothetical protein
MLLLSGYEATSVRDLAEKWDSRPQVSITLTATNMRCISERLNTIWITRRGR